MEDRELGNWETENWEAGTCGALLNSCRWESFTSAVQEEFCTLVFKTSTLKKIEEKYKDKLTKNVGDDKASKCVIIPIKEIFSKEFYNTNV